MSEPNADAKTGVSGPAKPHHASRAVGVLAPDHERMRRACKALRDGRLDDVRPNIDAIGDEDDPTGAWTDWLTGRLLARRHRAVEALGHLERCVAACGDAAVFARLRAAALEDIGVLRRRREELPQARQAHEAAYRLRCEHGSSEECWSSAHEVALTSIIAGELADAEAWCRRALDLADALEAAQRGTLISPTVQRGRPEPPGSSLRGVCESGTTRERTRSFGSADLCRAQSLALFADVASKRHQPDAAVEHARRSLESHTRADSGSLDTVKSEATLVRLLVTLAEASLGTDQDRVTTALEEAIERAPAVEQSLRAFEADSDADRIRDLVEFAERLHGES